MYPEHQSLTQGGYTCKSLRNKSRHLHMSGVLSKLFTSISNTLLSDCTTNTGRNMAKAPAEAAVGRTVAKEAVKMVLVAVVDILVLYVQLCVKVTTITKTENTRHINNKR